MARNRPAEFALVNIAVPGGGQDQTFPLEDVATYNADPDGYAANLLGLTKREYLEWVDLDGVPLCGHRTQSGDLCRNLTGGSQLRAPKWKERHRKRFCHLHGGDKATR
jgi:hypothetical protein